MFNVTGGRAKKEERKVNERFFWVSSLLRVVWGFFGNDGMFCSCGDVVFIEIVFQFLESLFLTYNQFLQSNFHNYCL